MNLYLFGNSQVHVTRGLAMIFPELHVPVVLPVICHHPSRLSHSGHPSHSVISAIQHILVISVISSHFSYPLSSQSSLAIPVIHPYSSQSSIPTHPSHPSLLISVIPLSLVIPVILSSQPSNTSLLSQSSLAISVIPCHHNHL